MYMQLEENIVISDMLRPTHLHPNHFFFIFTKKEAQGPWLSASITAGGLGAMQKCDPPAGIVTCLSQHWDKSYMNEWSFCATKSTA